MSEFDSYQEWTRSVAFYPQQSAIAYTTLGLAGEAGEVANLVKKEIRDAKDRREDIKDELGDVLWYVARVADEYGFSLSDVALLNVRKLNKRKEEREAANG